MPFDIHQKVLSRDGEVLEKKARAYQDQLCQLFEQAPEGKALLDEGIEPAWASMFIDFGINYLNMRPLELLREYTSENSSHAWSFTVRFR